MYCTLYLLIPDSWFIPPPPPYPSHKPEFVFHVYFCLDLEKGKATQFWPGELHELYSLWDRKESDMTERLSLSLAICMSSLKICLFRPSVYFFVWVARFFLMSSMSYLYISEIKSLSVTSFASIFSWSVGYLFIFYGFLCYEKVYKFDLVSFVSFCFYFYFLGSPKKTLAWFMSENVLPRFSSRSFILSCCMSL